MKEYIENLDKYEIDLEDLKLVSKILNRNCDDDICDDTNAALAFVVKAIITIERRESKDDYVSLKSYYEGQVL